MRILIITSVYPPESVVSARTSDDIAQAAVAMNAKVSVFAPFPNRPEGALHKDFRGIRLWKSYPDRGVNVIRLRSFISQSGSLLSRGLENLSFGILAATSLIFARQQDVIYLNTWPVVATALAAFVARIRRLPYIVSIQDLYPESLVTQGRIHSASWFYHFLLRIDNWICDKAADRILISERMRETYAIRGAEWAKRAHVIPNWIDIHKSGQADEAAHRQFRMELGVPISSILIVYGGNVGKASGLISVIESFGQFNEDNELYLLISGSGSELKRCRDLAQSIGNPRILFLSPWPHDQTNVVLGAADFLLLPTFGDQSLVSVPSKLLSYMAVGRPILALARKESEISSVILKSGCGLVGEPDNTGQFIEMISEVRAWSPEVRETRGLAGRAYALDYFDKESSVNKILALLERVSKEQR